VNDDARNGVTVGAGTAPFSTGAASGSIIGQPQTTQRLARAVLSWQGAAGGADMPVGAPFVTVRRLVDASWIAAADDMGLQIVWRVDDAGKYTAQWEIPLDATAGTYDVVVTANHYTLTSAPFTVVPSTGLVAAGASPGVVHVGYPVAVENVDITARPGSVNGGVFDGRRFSGATVAAVSVPAGAVLDAYGNCNGSGYNSAGTVTSCPAADSGPNTTSASVGGASPQNLPNTASTPASTVLPSLSVFALGAVLGRRSLRRRRALQ
jgi:hypothetical protein